MEFFPHLLFFVLLTATAIWSKPICAPGAVLNHSGSKCFYIFPVFYDFDTADGICKVRSLRFASIDNAEDNKIAWDYALQHFKHLGETTTFIWLGGFFDNVKKKLVWVNGSNSTFIPSVAKEKQATLMPAGFESHKGMGCLAMNVEIGLWFSTDCTTPIPFLCEGESINNEAE
ncbi:hypothetical protein L596_022731 [Steinernema carpocapsae]|uniref:C-type lectin domain-containing protein n=1 Tax=Steinernema carpocapsae TaxID=34508 RepID=A0A4U5MMJ7_STECR|nr:hypothetical protein L596_022731 [Steinernema carpocapsae]